MLILVRHGQSEMNAAGVLVGRSDPALTERGVRQAEATGRHLARVRDSRGAGDLPLVVVTSPLRRARRTAAVLLGAAGYAVEVDLDERLAEIDYGELEGLDPGEVGEARWEAWRRDPSWRPPGGETLSEVHARVASWCEEVAAAAATGDVLAVSHVSPIKAAAAWAIGAGPELAWRTTLAVAAITCISTAPRALHSFGEGGHLLGL